MSFMSMERRIAGIIKWLERCLKACDSGAMESALMDVECARADIENLRNEVWEKLERRYDAKERSQWSWMSVNAVAGALVAVLIAATPTAFFHEDRISAPERQDIVTLEWVTPDEKMLLGNLRKHLSENNSYASAAELEARVEPEPAAGPTVRAPGKQAALKTASEAEDTDINDDISYERFFSLLQAGEKALKNDQPAIKIEM